jgi:hypothetical protein
MIKGFAPIVTRVLPITQWVNNAIFPTNAEVTPVYSGKSLRIWGASVSNISGGNITVAVLSYPTGAAAWSAFMAANQTIVLPIPFVVGDNSGISVACTTINGASFTFFHSNIT